ncbi:glycine-rich domain-containing protein, partial [Risungbinella massiliensis]|uniref:hypothetical protein n=1 Tax=Risungbinella massiliensis TaxID=1329796 RepID=UPI0005CC8B3D
MLTISEQTLDLLNVSHSTREKLEELKNYDLSFLTDNFTDEHHKEGRKFSAEQIYPIVKHFGKADREIAHNIEQEFRKFVALTLIRPGVTHAPSGPVDMYWHFFILHTEEYRNFCTAIWGGFYDN